MRAPEGEATQQVRRFIQSLPEGAIFGREELPETGLDSTETESLLLEFAGNHEVVRMQENLYTSTQPSRFGTLHPRLDRVIPHLEVKLGAAVAPSGATCANGLGLTLGVPVRTVLWTNAPDQTLELGGQTVKLKNVEDWQTLLPHRRAGHIVRAVSYMGNSHPERLREKLSKVMDQEAREELQSIRNLTPAWVQEITRTLLESD